MDHYAVEAYFDTLATTGQSLESETELKIKILEFKTSHPKFSRQITAVLFDDFDEEVRYAYIKSSQGGVYFDQIHTKRMTTKKIATLEEWSRGSEWIRESLGY